MQELAGMEFDQESISFSRNEWKHFIEEVELRKGKEISKCVNNARYLSQLDYSDEQAKRGEVTRFTWEEWKEFVNNARRAVS